MNEYASDIPLWLFLGFSLAVGYRSIVPALDYIRALAVSPDPDDEASKPRDAPKPRLQQAAEDALTVKTLRNLSEGYSHDLRTAAIKIVATRSIKSSTKDLLLSDLTSQNEDARDNAINGLWLLLYSPALTDKHFPSQFSDQATFSALITALVNVLPEHDRTLPRVAEDRSTMFDTESPSSPVRPLHRPAHEVSLLIMLHLLLLYRHPDRYTSHTNNNIAPALSAGLVTRWLANYPFPCSLPQNSHMNYKRSDITGLFERKSWASDDPLMGEVMQIIMHSAEGVKQLREAGLRKSSYKENVDQDGWVSSDSPWNHAWDEEDDVAMLNVPEGDAARLSWHRFVAGVRPRSSERSHESLRRRHREAIVVAEPGIPLGREHILQRVEGPRDPFGEIAGERMFNEAMRGDSEPELQPDIVSLRDLVNMVDGFQRLILPIEGEMTVDDLKAELDRQDLTLADVRRLRGVVDRYVTAVMEPFRFDREGNRRTDSEILLGIDGQDEEFFRIAVERVREVEAALNGGSSESDVVE